VNVNTWVKMPGGEGLQKSHVLLTPTVEGHLLAHIYLQFLRTSRSETETVTKSWWLTEVGQDGEVNHWQLLNVWMKCIQNKYTP